MKNAILKKGQTITEMVIDKETGEILDINTKTHTFLANTKESFFIGYSSLIGAFMQMSQAEIRIFGYCLRFAKGVKFDISKKVRLDIANCTAVNERTVLNTLPSLLEKKILYKHADGLYQINPRYAFEGSTSDRNNQLKAIIELGCRDC